MDIRTKEILKFVFNIAFAIYNCVLGIASYSRWFVCVGAYYIVLGSMRIFVIAFGSKERKNEKFIMRFSGVLVFLLSIILSGIVYMTVKQNVAVKYHEIAMITIATYAFTKLGLAIYEYLKSRKTHSPYLKTLTSISFSDAVVSIYSLQRSMLVSFGGMAYKDITLFNILSGIGMCIVVFLIGLNLITGKEN